MTEAAEAATRRSDQERLSQRAVLFVAADAPERLFRLKGVGVGLHGVLGNGVSSAVLDMYRNRRIL